MKTALALFIGFILCAGTAYGQAGYFGMYCDQTCYCVSDFKDQHAALVPVYVVHKMCPGATASRFMVQPGGGWVCTFTGEVIANPDGSCHQGPTAETSWGQVKALYR